MGCADDRWLRCSFWEADAATAGDPKIWLKITTTFRLNQDPGASFALADSLDAAIEALLDTLPGPPDTTPPVISAVGASSITTTGATISWTTDEASDTQVEYGTTTAYGSTTTLDTSRTVSHSQALGGLAAGTLYHYRVKSRDAAGNLATSADFTFTTASPPPGTIEVRKTIVPADDPGRFDLRVDGEGVPSEGELPLWHHALDREIECHPLVRLLHLRDRERG